MLIDSNSLIFDFVKAANLAGFPIMDSSIQFVCFNAPHTPPSLPKGKQAVYTFSLTFKPYTILKIGGAGPNSKRRYSYQHYNPDSSDSNLSKSILNNKDKWPLLGINQLSKKMVGEWLMKNTDRNDFLISADHSLLFRNYLEIFMQCKLMPLFEGKIR